MTDKVVKDTPGFLYLELGDARPDKRMSRLGWLVFSDDADLAEAMNKLDNAKVKLID